MTSNIRLIIFDLGNVIVPIDMNRTIQQMEALGITNIQRHVTQSHSIGGVFTDFEQGMVSPSTFCESLRQMTSIKATDEELCHAWNAMIGPLSERTVRLVEQLKKNYTVVILSNTNQIHKEYFDTLASPWGYPSLADLFDHVWYSHEMHLSKPSEAIFRSVLNHHGVLPSEALFFDDSKVNIEAAHTLGINTCWVDPHAHILETDGSTEFSLQININGAACDEVEATLAQIIK
ncbi:MAG: HAD family phosphatase [Bacteroidales bacterium]|nr:HAD family phosphatase [Bacteroidales bacterium]